MTDGEYTLDERNEEAGVYYCVSEATKALAERLRRKPLRLPEPRLSELDKAVLRMEAE